MHSHTLAPTPPPSSARARVPPCACAASRRSPHTVSPPPPHLSLCLQTRPGLRSSASRDPGVWTHPSSVAGSRTITAQPCVGGAGYLFPTDPQLAPHSPRWAGRSCGFRPLLLRRRLPGLWLRLPPQGERNGYQRPFPKLHSLGLSCCRRRGRALRGSPGRPR